MVSDVTVVGAGVIALATALELADRGVGVRLVGTVHSGSASQASGGMLAPSVERELGPAGRFAEASRDFYPGWVAALETRTTHAIPLNTLGILEVALDEAEADVLHAAMDPPSSWLDARTLALEEPALADAAGAVFHPRDGCVEPLRLLDALEAAVARNDRIEALREDVVSLKPADGGVVVATDLETRFGADVVVLAAGAWTPLIQGVNAAAVPVEPVAGEMISLEGVPLRHVVYGAGGYLIPRVETTVAGSTMSHSGFEATVTEDGGALLAARARRLCPAFRQAKVTHHWAGLRPMTSDGLPYIGRDPDDARIIHASGHSRNGVLLAPLTAVAVADLATGIEPRYDLSRFRPGRHLNTL